MHAAAPVELQLRLEEEVGTELLLAPQRPPSALVEAATEWDVSLSEVQQLFEKAAGQENTFSLAAPPTTRVHRAGYTWLLQLTAKWSTQGVKMGLYLRMAAPSGCGNVMSGAAFASMHVAGTVGEVRVHRAVLPCLTGTGRGFQDFFGLGPRATWDAAAWHSAGLVEGGKVRIRVKLSDPA